MSTNRRTMKYMDVDELIDAPTNAKDHDDELIDASLRRFRLIETPVLDERTGKLIAGHGRRDALRAMRVAGEAAPDGVEVTKDGRWLTPVTRGWASADDDEAEAAGIALNRVGEAGGWKESDLAATLQRLSAAGPLALVGVGYDQGDLAEMLSRLTPPTPLPGDADAQPRLDVRNPIECPNCGHKFHRV